MTTMPEAGSRLRILVVDDEPFIGNVLRQVLMPHEVVVAISGATALEALRDGAFDLVICDIVMPGMTGPDVFAAVCSAKPDMRERFVFISGGGASAELHAQVKATACPVITKPFDLAVVRALVECYAIGSAPPR